MPDRSLNQDKPLVVAGVEYQSRLIIGSGKAPIKG
jgi:thiazole synthase ThiGH ThiG subunit